MDSIFQLTILLSIAVALGIIARMLKQPVLLAYLATGIVLGYFNLFNVSGNDSFRLLADLGIMFLLFLVGLEINYSSLKQVGKVSVVAGLGQVLFTAGIGFFIAKMFGFGVVPSAYIAIALTFSSTIIIVKLLSEKKDTNSLYGKISIGFMLVQDFVAIIILILLTGVQSGNAFSVTAITETLIKGIVLFGIMFWLGRKIIPFIFEKIARSQELLFVTSVAWMLIVASAVTKLGLNIEIGGFLAGIALANSSENLQISSKLKPLRDLFILIFFVILGSSLIIFDFSGIIIPIIVFSLFVLIGNPLIVMIILGFMGYRRRTGFMAGVTVAQISEFSLIIAALGLKVGHVGDDIVRLITAVGVITITISTYIILYSEKIAKKMHNALGIFEREELSEEIIKEKILNKSIILIGANRTGESIVHHLNKEDLLIIDFDPDIARKFSEKGYDVLFGDISDEEVFESANFEKSKLVISTSPDYEDNSFLLKKLENISGKRKIIVRAETNKETELLYKKGASYVIFPHLTSGHYIGKNISEDMDVSFLADMKSHDLGIVKKRA